MLHTNTETFPNHEITEVIGVFTGNVVQSKHLGRDIMALLKGLIGGELGGYTEMLTEARQTALQRLLDEAQRQGADGVVNIRFTSSAIVQGASEIMAYGTAVKLQAR